MIGTTRLPAQYLGGSATTWKPGSLTVWEGKAAATAATATPAARIACYELPGQKNRLWLNKAANRNEFNSIVLFPLAPIFVIRWWSCRSIFDAISGLSVFPC
jgi:hypothetical protein